MSDVAEFVLDREFDAPRALVWRAWTEPELLARWYGPNVETVIHQFDLQPDGVWLNEMKMSSKSMFQKVVFKEITKPERMIWHHYSSVDSDWNETENAMMPDWPRILLTTVAFEDRGEKTNVRLTQIPHKASAAEIACFAQMMAGMSGGWGKGYAIIDEMLAELQAG